MCGICGIIDFENKNPDKKGFEPFLSALRHRGPDDSGIYSDENVLLGSQRLAIIDLSKDGHMPMSNENGGSWITFNGEIYNFQLLRKELEQAGHVFRSHTDSEVILHAYEQWGEDSLKKLYGMFAFAIWDRRKKELFIARDRLGVKPVYYALENRKLFFASEVHVLYEHLKPDINDLDPVALDFYFSFGYVPGDRCIFSSVRKLPPGHFLKFSEDNLTVSRYWEMHVRPGISIKNDEALEETDRLLRKAVERRLKSDVPLGCFLSGGIDSGLVTAISAELTGNPVHTFSVGFSGGRNTDDERPLAKLVAGKYKTHHKELTVSPEGKEILPQLIWHFGDPFADVSAIPVLEISRAARENIKVALTGDGGDESFAGYENIRVAYLTETLKRFLPDRMLQSFPFLFSSLNYKNSFRSMSRLKYFFEHYVNKQPLMHYDLVNLWNGERRNLLFKNGIFRGNALPPALSEIDRIQKRSGSSSLADIHQFTDFHVRLPADYLTKVDIASNMVSLEIRSPFLDHELVEFAASLPLSIKMPFYRQKGLLRELAKKYLPDELIRQPKRGFGPRLGEWIRKDWAAFIKNTLFDKLCKRDLFFNAKVIEQTVQEHLSGMQDHTTRIWILVVFELWLEIFIDRTLKPTDKL